MSRRNEARQALSVSVTIGGHRLVYMSGIAWMGEVTRPAVMNWINRHTDFPKPIAGTEYHAPMFDYTEARAWLELTGRFKRDVPID